MHYGYFLTEVSQIMIMSWQNQEFDVIFHLNMSDWKLPYK